MTENTYEPYRARYTFVEEIRRNALDFIPELQKLRLSFRRNSAFATGQLIQRRAANLAVNYLPRGIRHRKIECHSAIIVADDLAAFQRH